MCCNKTKPVPIKSDNKNLKKKKKPVKQPYDIKTPQVFPSKEVHEVIPFDAYKHKLTQPFWCEYCNKKGQLREYYRLALRYSY